MQNYRHADVQGYFLGVPYDWRAPRYGKVKARIWNENGPLFPPKVFGWGWTINFKHRAAKWIIGASTVAALVAIIVS